MTHGQMRQRTSFHSVPVTRRMSVARAAAATLTGIEGAARSALSSQTAQCGSGSGPRFVASPCVTHHEDISSLIGFEHDA